MCHHDDRGGRRDEPQRGERVVRTKFGVDDEIRIIDKSGNPVGLSHAMRAYSSTESSWLVVSLDVYRGRIAESKGQLPEQERREHISGGAQLPCESIGHGLRNGGKH